MTVILPLIERKGVLSGDLGICVVKFIFRFLLSFIFNVLDYQNDSSYICVHNKVEIPNTLSEWFICTELQEICIDVLIPGIIFKEGNNTKHS